MQQQVLASTGAATPSPTVQNIDSEIDMVEAAIAALEKDRDKIREWFAKVDARRHASGITAPRERNAGDVRLAAIERDIASAQAEILRLQGIRQKRVAFEQAKAAEQQRRAEAEARIAGDVERIVRDQLKHVSAFNRLSEELKALAAREGVRVDPWLTQSPFHAWSKAAEPLIVRGGGRLLESMQQREDARS